MKNYLNLIYVNRRLLILLVFGIFFIWILYGMTWKNFRVETSKNTQTQSNETLIFVKPSQKQIRLIGDIYPSTVEILSKILTENSDIEEVSVDTTGGDVKSALRIANILKAKDLGLIVNGKCFSACALFLFPSAPRKKIMPQSLVAIHGFRYWINIGNSKQEIQTHELHEMASSSVQTGTYIEYKKIAESLDEFYLQSQINVTYIKSFNDFLERRVTYFSNLKKNVNGAGNCPAVEFWSMDQRKLEEFGVKGIEIAWYPNSVQERNELLRRFNIENRKVFWGNKEDIDNFCR